MFTVSGDECSLWVVFTVGGLWRVWVHEYEIVFTMSGYAHEYVYSVFTVV